MGVSISESRGQVFRTLLLITALLALAIAGGTAAALYLKKPPNLPSKEVSALEPSPAHLNFGEVWEDTQFTIVLPITNRRTHDIDIKRFHKTCNCSKIEPPSLTIPAGQTREVLVTFDLSPKHPEEMGLSVRDFAVGITPVISEKSDKGSRMDWRIRGRVRAAFQCDPPFVDFGRVSELAQPLPSQRVPIKTFASLHSIKATCPSLRFNVKAERRSPKEPDRFDLIISPAEPLPRGEIRCIVELKAVLADGKILPVKKV